MSIIGSNILAGASGQGGGGYTIERSVRLRSSASAYFSRTPASAGNRKTWTWSGWVKRGKLGSRQFIFATGTAPTPSTVWQCEFSAEDKLDIYNANINTYRRTTQVFRDVGAWYHLVLVADTSNGVAADRFIVYVNGERVTAFDVNSTISQNYDLAVNQATRHALGTYSYSPELYFDGYLTEVNFIDGQALTPDSFGEYNEDTGVWQPIAYTGTYGTNGFYLDFNDNTTTTTLAEDKSGNGNDWTANNISLTSGVTYDSMTDTPTIYAGGGNYAVLNPLSKGTSQTNVIDGNLYAIPISGASNWGTVFSSIAIPTSGKWYIEATAQIYAGSGNNSSLGVVDSASFIPTNTAILYQYTTGEGFDGILAHLFSDYVSPIADGVQGTNVTGLTGTSINLMLALDVDNGKVYAGYNGTWLNAGNPAGNTGEVATRTFSASDVVAGHTSWNGTNDQSQYYNFGQRPFAYTPPTGFLPLHTGNLPEPEIVDGGEYFNTVLYTGNGSTQSITGVGFAPDLTWMKQRSGAQPHGVFDNLRGNGGALLRTNATDAENNGGFIDLTTDGFDVLISDPNWNGSGATYVAWNWKANGAGVSNTDGSITSTVSANPTAGFSIVSYTGNGSGSATVGHGLNVKPQVVILKNRDAVEEWSVLHQDLGDQGTYYYYLELNTTTAKQASGTKFPIASPWNSSVFPLGTNAAINGSGNDLIAYCFAEVPSFSKMGSYVGNGSTDGPFVYLGFRPAFVMVKRTNSTGNWAMSDNKREGYNKDNDPLYANLTNVEGTDDWVDFVANGFKLRASTGDFNTSGGTYIYMAFAENPFKNSLAR